MQADLFKKSAVLLEQNLIEANLFKDILVANGFDVYISKSPMDALVKLREKEQDLLVLDMEVAGRSFIEKFLQNVRKEKNCERMSVVGVSIYPKEEHKESAEELDACLVKPFSIDAFVEAIFQSIEKRTHCEEVEAVGSF